MATTGTLAQVMRLDKQAEEMKSELHRLRTDANERHKRLMELDSIRDDLTLKLEEVRETLAEVTHLLGDYATWGGDDRLKEAMRACAIDYPKLWK